MPLVLFLTLIFPMENTVDENNKERNDYIVFFYHSPGLNYVSSLPNLSAGSILVEEELSANV